MFAYERLGELANRQRCDRLNVLGAGSGLTFFPHFVVTRHPNISIHCSDCDPQVQIDAGGLITPAARAVSYSIQDISALTYPDASFDTIYCISVLGHCDHYTEILAGFARILKPGGRLMLTMDISPDGRSEIPREQAALLIKHLEQWFVPDSDYESMIDNLDEAQILTTAYARKMDPSLLPWGPPGWRQSLRHFFAMCAFLSPLSVT